MKKVRGVTARSRPTGLETAFASDRCFHTEKSGGCSAHFFCSTMLALTTLKRRMRRGVGQHAHRGFEIVTIVYNGEVEHRDSTGHGGIIGPGNVQWMTAGNGILLEEFHSEAFGRASRLFRMVQLCVKLPAQHKMVQPGYQAGGGAPVRF